MDSSNCRTLTASPAEPGDLPIGLEMKRRSMIVICIGLFIVRNPLARGFQTGTTTQPSEKIVQLATSGLSQRVRYYEYGESDLSTSIERAEH